MRVETVLVKLGKFDTELEAAIWVDFMALVENKPRKYIEEAMKMTPQIQDYMWRQQRHAMDF